MICVQRCRACYVLFDTVVSLSLTLAVARMGISIFLIRGACNDAPGVFFLMILRRVCSDVSFPLNEQLSAGLGVSWLQASLADLATLGARFVL